MGCKRDGEKIAVRDRVNWRVGTGLATGRVHEVLGLGVLSVIDTLTGSEWTVFEEDVVSSKREAGWPARDRVQPDPASEVDDLLDALEDLMTETPSPTWVLRDQVADEIDPDRWLAARERAQALIAQHRGGE